MTSMNVLRDATEAVSALLVLIQIIPPELCLIVHQCQVNVVRNVHLIEEGQQLVQLIIGRCIDIRVGPRRNGHGIPSVPLVSRWRIVHNDRLVQISAQSIQVLDDACRLEHFHAEHWLDTCAMSAI